MPLELIELTHITTFKSLANIHFNFQLADCSLFQNWVARRALLSRLAAQSNVLLDFLKPSLYDIRQKCQSFIFNILEKIRPKIAYDVLGKL